VICIENSIEGIFFIELEENTIASFLFWLNKLPQSAPRMDAPVLQHYLSFSPETLKQFNDLNAKLLNSKSA